MRHHERNSALYIKLDTPLHDYIIMHVHTSDLGSRQKDPTVIPLPGFLMNPNAPPPLKRPSFSLCPCLNLPRSEANSDGHSRAVS